MPGSSNKCEAVLRPDTLRDLAFAGGDGEFDSKRPILINEYCGHPLQALELGRELARRGRSALHIYSATDQALRIVITTSTPSHRVCKFRRVLDRPRLVHPVSRRYRASPTT